MSNNEAIQVVSQLPPAPQTLREAPVTRITPQSTPAQTDLQIPDASRASSKVTLPAFAQPAMPKVQAQPVQTQSVPEKPVAHPAKPASLRAITQKMGLPLPLPAGRIVVWKAQRRLELWNGSKLVKYYGVALGANPVGHKQSQGDNRTPEGQYFICTRNAETSAFHIFLGLSYPALPDAARGVRSNAISAREFQIIQQRLASRSAPLWRTRLGGWVGIHGGTGQPFAKRKTKERRSPDWTAGCVALTNREIEELYAATKLGTPVLVKP